MLADRIRKSFFLWHMRDIISVTVKTKLKLYINTICARGIYVSKLFWLQMGFILSKVTTHTFLSFFIFTHTSGVSERWFCVTCKGWNVIFFAKEKKFVYTRKCDNKNILYNKKKFRKQYEEFSKQLQLKILNFGVILFQSNLQTTKAIANIINLRYIF